MIKYILSVNIVDTIAQFFNSLSGYGFTTNVLFFMGLGLELALVLFFIIKSYFSYEGRLERSLDKLNIWLYRNQTIDSKSLIEFNYRMKKAPKLLRYHWQQYMLYREKDPSHYISAYNCIDKPLNTSSYLSNIKNLNAWGIAITFFSFVLSLAMNASAGAISFSGLLTALIIPSFVLLLNTIFVMTLRTMQNYNLGALYQYFHLFQRYIDRASATIPEYVDFEVLFTKQEIKKGIPVLNEYLEKRTRQEQEELERASRNAVEHEIFDFSKAGIESSLVLDRAMKEAEVYINSRQRTLTEIQQLESEIESNKRNYENTSKEYQRKLQASKETVDRLRKQMEETTNRIESNYIKKQQQDELNKQEILEKDQDDATLRFNQEVSALKKEIEKRRNEVESKKESVEEAMLAEYQTFSSKLYEKISQTVDEKFDAERQELNSQRDEAIAKVDELNAKVIDREQDIKQLQRLLDKNKIDYRKSAGYFNEELEKEVRNRRLGKPEKKEIVYDEFGGYYDERGYYIYENGTYYDDKGNFYDSEGGIITADGTYIPANARDNIAQPTQQNIQNDIVSSPTADYKPVEELEPVTDKDNQAIEPKEKIRENIIPDPNMEYDDYGGYYDARGYYIYKNGTYYDNEGYYFDEKGGYYDPQGNYYPPKDTDGEKGEGVDESPVELKKIDETELPSEEPEKTTTTTQALPVEEPVKTITPTQALPVDENVVSDQPDEYGGHYDERGFYVYPNGAYYDDKGQYFDEYGGKYDTEGNYFPPQDKGKDETKIADKIEEPKQKEDAVNPSLAAMMAEENASKAIFEKHDLINAEAKTVDVAPAEDFEVFEEVTRKRGRPRKILTEDEINKVKRPRGRPKKEIDPEEANKPKKPRGRPKKQVDESQQKEKNPRGRPKSKQELEDISKKIFNEQEKLLAEHKELNDQLAKTLKKL